MTGEEHKTVIIYKHNGSGWVKVRSFGIALTGWITLSVKNNQIKCCSAGDDKITVYSMIGELLHTYGTRGHEDLHL